MFTLQIQCNTIEDAEKILATLKFGAGKDVVQQVADQIPAALAAPGESQAAEPAPALPDTKPKNPRGRPRREVAEKPAASTDTATSTAPGDTGVDPSAASTQQAPTLDDARAALKAVQAKYGTDDMSKPLEILGQFSAGRISEVKPEQYPDFITACKAA